MRSSLPICHASSLGPTPISRAHPSIGIHLGAVHLYIQPSLPMCQAFPSPPAILAPYPPKTAVPVVYILIMAYVIDYEIRTRSTYSNVTCPALDKLPGVSWNCHCKSPFMRTIINCEEHEEHYLTTARREHPIIHPPE